MRSKLSDLKSLYTTLGGESTDVMNAKSEIAVLNGILALGSVDSSRFIPDAIKAIADNFNSIDPSPSLTLDTANVTPTTSAQTMTPDSGHAYKKVEVAAVTSAIDQNIVAGNIKKDVQILGVTGNYEGSGADTFEVILNSTDGETFTPNKTFAETVAAMQNQTPVTMKMHVEVGGQTSEQVASFFYNAIEPENINAIYIPVYFTSSAVNGFIWNENGFGTSSFNASMTIT